VFHGGRVAVTRGRCLGVPDDPTLAVTRRSRVAVTHVRASAFQMTRRWRLRAGHVGGLHGGHARRSYMSAPRRSR
jgi:hypothetical protein